MSRKRGRNRKPVIDREPNGRARRVQTDHIIPLAALAQRATALGIDVEALIHHGSEAVSAICRDPGAGTALGRLTWKTHNDGSRERRVGDFGSGPEEWITADMEAAAEEYRTLWVRWYRMVGLPRRHPQGMALERRDKGEEASDAATDDAVIRVGQRMADADAALLSCRQSRLVLAVIDSVLIDNIAPDGLVLGERSAALSALRRGLDALSQVLLRGRKNTA
ncbi:hypothetical protein A6A04_13395 [Paramagnetospirillum marisnigri]|uniref:Uncharacterized protein n=1 Tax=Paramagnetospirillum marisnigri TaxID=1285242 RepID=A0A178MX42_9PROT|nr:hypothetical protein [Paramagnetospirillum marisnigri]OAN53882.1 hypothetical protein A6A04_13395 [Paramagnetospirillum marisnigri]